VLEVFCKKRCHYCDFVALAEHIKAKLWTSDHALIKGLKKKNWNRIITTKELYQLSIKERKRK
jgi:predicted nucleic acid-binding protein